MRIILMEYLKYRYHIVKQDKVNSAVEEVIYKLVNNPKFQEALKTKVGAKTDTDELEKEREILSLQTTSDNRGNRR